MRGYFGVVFHSQVTWRLSFMSADLYTDLTIGLGMKNYPKMTPHMSYSMHWFPNYMKVIFHVSWFVHCLIPCLGSQVTWRSSSMSADLYSDLTIGLDMKNYPKMTPHMFYSMHCFPSYMKVVFNVSWMVQWPHHWIGHEKLPKNDPSNSLFRALVPKL